MHVLEWLGARLSRPFRRQFVRTGGEHQRREGQAADREQLVAVLTRHGLSETAASAVVEVGERLRQRTAVTGDEHAATLSARTGRRAGPLVHGTPTMSRIDRQLTAMLDDHPYVQLHTHPSSGSLSDQDGLLLLAQQGLIAMVVVGADGTWYVLSKQRNRRPAGATELQALFLAWIDAGGARDAHQAWQRIAAEVDLRYDRA